MDFRRLCELTRLADLEYKDEEILKVKKYQLVEALEDARNIIAKLEAEVKTAKAYNANIVIQLNKCVMAKDKGVFLESLG